jgi:hypothetical protein
MTEPILSGYMKPRAPGSSTPSKGHHARRPADTYLELRDWEGKVSVFRPDMATGVLEVFDWYVL